MSTIDRDTFSFWVAQPQDTSPGDMPRLEAAVKAFPYCQITYSLLAKAASRKSTNALMEVLPRAAVCALNRNALRRLVENEFDWSESLVNRFTDLPHGLEKPISLLRYENRFGLPGGGLPGDGTSTRETNDKQVLSEQLPVDDTVVTEKVIEEELTQKRLKPVPLPSIDLLPTAEPRENIRQKQQELIEKFIQNDPRIGPIRATAGEIPEPVDLTARNQTTLDGMATESMAKILARQGKADKAIAVYKKLILKNPEKKDYFVEKINELSGGK
jgi:tetratricopeptide (TPR) repeat protein